MFNIVLEMTYYPLATKLWGGILFSSRQSVHPFTQEVKFFFSCTALRMLELIQKGLCNNYNFIFQGLWLSFLVKLNATGFGKFFTKLKYLEHILAWKFIYRYILIIATFL